MNVTEVILRMSRIKGVGNSFINRLWKSYNASLHFDIDDFMQYCINNLSDSQKYYFDSDFQLTDAVSVVTIADPGYPKSLSDFGGNNTPPFLTLMGNNSLIGMKGIAISGSRKVSQKGLEITRSISSEIVKKGFCVISGYAGGVDREAIHASLTAGGNVIIVLPQGMGDFKIRRELKDIWDWNRILVVSEFQYEDSWTVARAMQRNATIIGLSDALIVVEAGSTGGSLDAGRKSLMKKKKVFVPRYGEYPESALGNEMLIHEGAQPILRKSGTSNPNLNVMWAQL